MNKTTLKETRLFGKFGLANIELSLNPFMTVGPSMASKKNSRVIHNAPFKTVSNIEI